MVTKTQVANMALTLIGQSTISAITEDTPTATKLNTIYDIVLDEALSAGPQKGWKFARNRAEIDVDAEEPAFEYDYRFALPSEHLRTVWVGVENEELVDWIQEGGYILTNEEDTTIDMIYVKRETNHSRFPPHSVKMLYYMLAYHLAYNIIQSSTHAERVYTILHEVVLPKAIAIDEQERYVEETNNDWQEAGR